MSINECGRVTMPGTITTVWRAAFAVVALGALMAGAAADYQVARGDTLSGIAARHQVSVDELAAMNALDDPDLIWAGQTLKVPSSTSPASLASHAEVGALIEEVARSHGWSPAFVKALAWQESGWDNDRVSSAGAIGIMQVMPQTGEFISRELMGRELDLHDPYDNVVAGVTFLQHLWEITGGDVERTLAGYYQGLRSVGRYGRFATTDRYIANVLALRDRFR